MPTTTGRLVGSVRDSQRSLGGIVGLVGVALVFNRYSGLDRMVSGWFYDARLQRFPLRNEWLLSSVLHDGGKWLAVAMVLALAASWLLLRRMQSSRARSFVSFTLLVALLCAGVVALVKSGSSHSCPWSLTTYGGTADFYRIGDALPAHPGPGKCMPSGHASSAFMWIAAIYASRRWLPHYTKGTAALVGLLGVTGGLVQVARGAHFVSHILLTAALCWAICWTADALYSRWSVRHRDAMVPSETTA